MRNLLHLALLVILARGSHGFLAPRSEQQARYHVPPNKASIIPHSFIVALHGNHTIEDHYANIGVNISEVASAFNHLAPLNMYSFQLAAENSTLVHELIRRDPGIKRVGHNSFAESRVDTVFHHGNTSDHANPNHDQGSEDPSSLGKRWDNMLVKVQWHMAMVGLWDKIRMRPGFHPEYPEADSRIPLLEDAGKGVNIYVFDSGIRLGHVNFGTQKDKMWHFNSLVEDDKAPYCKDETMKDMEGHGTSVAIVAGGYNFGMLSPAWRANIVSVKVRCRSGQRLDQLLKAISDVVAEHVRYSENPPKGWRGSVINVSMGWPELTTDVNFGDAWRAVRDAGIPVAAAAGNSGKNEFYVPARYAYTYSVGAVDYNYERWDHSNYGRRLNTFAPGVYVPTADHINSKPIVASGTSIACPMVAGIMAMMVGYEGAWNIKSGRDIYDRLDANLVYHVRVDDQMRDSGTPPNLVNNGMYNPDLDRGDHPYGGIPWESPPDYGPEPFIKRKRQDNPYDNMDGDYRQRDYYEGPARTVEFSEPQPTLDYEYYDDDLDEGYFDEEDGTCDCEPR